MTRKRNLVYAGLGLASALMHSSGDVVAQCSGGGGRGAPPTGSASTLASVSPYASTPMAFANYSQTPFQVAYQPQQRALLIQNQAYVMANQIAGEQAQKRAAYEQRVRPFRLARAEAKRQAAAERIAARIAERDGNLMNSARNYTLTSTAVK